MYYQNANKVMKTTSLFNFAKLFAFALLVIFSACTQADDPVPTTPDNQNPTTGLPDLGGLGGGGGPTTPTNPTTPGGGTNDPTTPGGGGQTTEVVGRISSEIGNFEFPLYIGAETASQANDAGAYTTEYYYADQDAANDRDGDDNVEGVITAIAFNATNPGTISPGQHPYSPGASDANVFPYIMIVNRGRIYIVSEAQTEVGTTGTNGIYSVVFKGQAVEVEIVNEELNIVSNPFDIEGGFFIPATVSNNARYESKPNIKVPFSNLSDLSF